MEDSLSFRTILESNHVLVILDLPELDLEHESNLVLNIFPNECTFTAAPYHARISLSHIVHPGKAFPEHIDYEKSTVTFRIPFADDVKTADSKIPSYPYGFCRLYSGPLSLETSQELKVLSDPYKYSFTQRWEMKEEAENNDFHEEHYGMDYIQFAIDKLGLTLDNLSISCKLTEDQSYRIRVIVEEKIRNKETYTSSCIEDHRPVLLGLIDVLLAVGYDRLTNDNDLNEANSHINIHRISGTLAYFAEFPDMEQMLRSFYRRSCTYPYYRSKDLAMTCVQHVLNGISSENRKVWIQLQLLHAYEAFKTTECAVLNHYFVKDYVRYVELGLNVESLLECAESMRKILPDIYLAPLGFGEEKVIEKLLQDIITREELDSTDSDDYDTTDSESDESAESDRNNESTSSSPDVAVTDGNTNPNENVLEKLMNLKLSG